MNMVLRKLLSLPSKTCFSKSIAGLSWNVAYLSSYLPGTQEIEHLLQKKCGKNSDKSVCYYTPPPRNFPLD